MTGNRVIVFGGTGTVGAYTCLCLKEKGYDVIACGSRKTDNGFFSEYGIKYLQADITDRDSFHTLPQDNVCAVVNLSGMLPARMRGYNPQSYVDVNITGSLNILQYCAGVKPEVVITTKSISDVSQLCGNVSPIESDAISGFPLDNDHSVYCITKNAAADMLVHYAARYGFKYYILRFPNIYLYHPNPFYFVDGEERWQGYRLMIHKAIRGERIAIWGNPERVRDIVYVKDCAQIIRLCVGGQGESGTYNVGTGNGVSLRDQVLGIQEVFGKGHYGPDIEVDLSKPDAPEYIFDISKTVRNLGYSPKYDYIAYLEDFKDELRSQRFTKLWGEDRTGDNILL